MWQGALRCGDLFKRQRDARRPWSPELDTHRDLLSSALVRDMNREVIGPKLLLRLKPTKADYAGEQGLVRGFVLDTSPKSISAAAAIRDMLLHDPTAGDPWHAPLFRDRSTGRAITYETSQTAVASALKRAGFPELSGGSHALRIGGTTTLANAQRGWQMVSGSIGGWVSESRHLYMWVTEQRPDMATAKIGRGSSEMRAQSDGQWGRTTARVSHRREA